MREKLMDRFSRFRTFHMFFLTVIVFVMLLFIPAIRVKTYYPSHGDGKYNSNGTIKVYVGSKYRSATFTAIDYWNRILKVFIYAGRKDGADLIIDDTFMGNNDSVCIDNDDGRIILLNEYVLDSYSHDEKVEIIKRECANALGMVTINHRASLIELILDARSEENRQDVIVFRNMYRALYPAKYTEIITKMREEGKYESN